MYVVATQPYMLCLIHLPLCLHTYISGKGPLELLNIGTYMPISFGYLRTYQYTIGVEFCLAAAEDQLYWKLRM